MANDSELIVKITGDAKELKKAFDDAKKETEELNDGLKDMAKAAGLAFAALAAEGLLAVSAYREQEEATNDLIATLQQQGIYTQELFDSYVKVAEGLKLKTGADAEGIIKGQAHLQSMIGQIEISQELSAAVVDLAAKKKMDLVSAFELVGRAANGNMASLNKLGVTVTDQGNRAANLVEIQKGLADAFGGSAAAAAQGLGVWNLAKQAFMDIQQGIGERLAPAFIAAGQAVNSFFRTIADNKALLDLIVAAGTAAAVVTGLAAATGLAGTALIALRAALIAANVQISATAVLTRALVGATGIGLLVLVVTEIYLNWSTVWPRVYATFYAFAESVYQLGKGLGEFLIGVVTLNPQKMMSGFLEMEKFVSVGMKAFNDVVDKFEAERKAKEEKAEKEREAKNRRDAEAREAELRRREALEIAIEDSKNAVLLAKAEKYNDDVIKLAEEETQILTQLADDSNKEQFVLLEERLAQVREARVQALQRQAAEEETFQKQILDKNKEFNALSKADQEAFIEEHGAALRQMIDTETELRQTELAQELRRQIEDNNLKLEEQRKFGLAHAEINRQLRSEEMKGAKKLSGELVALQKSGNETLKGIGKAAALTQIAIKTAEGAAAARAGAIAWFGPVLGPPIGIAAAAAVIAYGAEQMANVTRAAEGGLLTGGVPGRDSIPVLGMPGELVVPTKNFEEVINAVAAQRIASQQPQAEPPAEGFAHIVLELKNDLMDFLEAKLVERRGLGISIQGA